MIAASIPTRRIWRLRGCAACAMVMASIALAGCGRSAPAAAESAAGSNSASRPDERPDEPDAIVLAAEEMHAGGIVVEPASMESRAADFETPATLQLDETRTARIGALVDGVVVETSVQVGTKVLRGALLASIHSHIVHEAWAGYRRAMAERRTAATELAFRKDAEARTERLLVNKAASAQEAARARADRAAAEEAAIIAESEVLRALDELDHLGIDGRALENGSTEHAETVPVAAAVGGTVLERLVTAGTAVTVGMPLFVVSDLRRLWAVAEIDERRLASLAVGRVASLTVAAYPGRTFSARVTAIGDTINPDTRRVTARLEVDNDDGALKPQMYAVVRVPIAEQVPVVVVPAAAVQKVDQQPVVFLETSPGHFVQRPVVTASERNGRVEIARGVRIGDRVAVAGTFLLKSKVLQGSSAE